MVDKFEREIEEILAKLDDDLPPGDGKSGRAPISLSAKRNQKAKAQRIRPARPNPLAAITPTHMLFAGAGVMFAGLIASNIWGPSIWASFAGVVLFIGAFIWSFRRTKQPGPQATWTGGTYWRDRYIDDRPKESRGKGRFRR